MNQIQAGLIRSLVQHHVHMHDPVFYDRFLDLLELDEEDDYEMIQAFEQFCDDIACHVLERLIT